MESVGSTLKVVDSFGKPVTLPRILSFPWFIKLFGHACVGLLILFINFPEYLRLIIEQNVGNEDIREIFHSVLFIVQNGLAYVIGPEPTVFFERAMTCAFMMIWLWLTLLIFVSVRHKDVRWIGLGFVGLIFGFYAPHLLAGFAVAFTKAFGASVIAFGWIKSVFGNVFGFFFDYRVIVIGLIASIGMLFLWKEFVRFCRWVFDLFLKYWAKIVASMTAFIAALFIIPYIWKWVLLPLWKWILAPVFGGILWLLGWIVAIILAVFAFLIVLALVPFTLAVLGAFFFAQLHAGWHAGRNIRLVLVAGFALGSLVTLIFLASAANPDILSSINTAWSNSLLGYEPSILSSINPIEAYNFLLPEGVNSFSQQYLSHAEAPAFDTAVLLIILSMAVISTIERLFSSRSSSVTTVPIKFVLWEYIKILLGVLVFLILIFTVGAGE